MKYLSSLVFVSVLFFACNNVSNKQKNNADTIRVYPTVSYLDVRLDSTGQLPSNPYILEFDNGNKKIVFCGTSHLPAGSSINNPMYTAIENRFFSFKPDVCVNEGGDVSKKKFLSKQDAVSKDGEIGLTKVLCDSLKIKTINGDPTTEFEFKELLKKYSKGEFLTYIVTERLMWGLYGQQIKDSNEIKKQYDDFIQNYIIGEGKVQLNQNEESFDFYRLNYKTLLGRPFRLKELEPTNPFDPKGKFQEIGRTSKNIRDQFLLKTIDSLLNTNDRVFVVFGGWHLLTCKPGLEEIIKQKRN